MRVFRILARDLEAFGPNLSGFEQIRRCNIIIGRNNVGKSRLLEFVETLCTDSGLPKAHPMSLSAVLSEKSLKGAFPTTEIDSRYLRGNAWSDHGIFYVDKVVHWSLNSTGEVSELIIDDEPTIAALEAQPGRRRSLITGIVAAANSPLTGRTYVHIAADRDIRPELSERTNMTLQSNGVNATNIIAEHINNRTLPSDLIEVELLKGLRTILAEDGSVDRISVRREDTTTQWEVNLSEPNKGRVPLSRSGSGLKTIILVLLCLLLNKDKKCVFSFEELENNLHPAMLRRLLRYISEYVRSNDHYLFLTTHSSVVLDFFASDTETSITRVTHDKVNASTHVANKHLDYVGIIGELGAKPSDLLQANGIVWVEGPSDRILIDKWIWIRSNGEFREGRDYQCACYGGALLARLQFMSPDAAAPELINLLTINPHFYVVCDKDRASDKHSLKPTVQRIRKEVKDYDAAGVWITGEREIENYYLGRDLQAASVVSKSIRNPNPGESFWPLKDDGGKSYLKAVLGRETYNKVSLATKVAAVMDSGSIIPGSDLEMKVDALIKMIRKWNT